MTASVFLTKAYLYSAAQSMLCRSAACMHAAEMHPETLKQVSIRIRMPSRMPSQMQRMLLLYVQYSRWI